MSKVSEAVDNRTDSPSQPPGDTPPRRSRLRTAGLAFLRQREATVLVVAIALIIYFSVSSSNFYGTSNLSTWLSQDSAYIMIIAVGEVFLLICGEIDLSVSFIFTFSPFLMHYLIDYYSVPVIPAILLSLLFGVIVGWVNGFLTVTVGLPSFITTLGTGFILYGLVLTTSNAYPANIPVKAASYAKIFGTQSGFGQWSPIIWGVVLVIIFQVVLVRTRYGLHTVATGGNLLGARESGINVARVKYTAFMITGFMGALAGLQTAFYDNTVDPSAGQYTPMFFAVTAAVIGGTAMLGGQGTILGAFLGGIVLATLINGLNVAGISANPLDIVFGLAILLSMIANVRLARLRAAGRN